MPLYDVSISMYRHAQVEMPEPQKDEFTQEFQFYKHFWEAEIISVVIATQLDAIFKLHVTFRHVCNKKEWVDFFWLVVFKLSAIQTVAT